MDLIDRQSDTISRQAAIDAAADMYHAAERWGEKATDDVIKARAESCMASLVEMKLRIEKLPSAEPEDKCSECDAWNKYKNYPSAEPEISRIEKELHGKTPEEQYDFIYWLLMKSALNYSNSRLAIIEWLRGEKEK